MLSDSTLHDASWWDEGPAFVVDSMTLRKRWIVAYSERHASWTIQERTFWLEAEDFR